jgi:hypothetical protein
MDGTGAERARAVEERGGNRDALIEGNIVADERQLDPNAHVGPHETGSDRVREEHSGEALGDPSGGNGSDREPAADAVLKDGSTPAEPDLDLATDAMNDPERLEDDSRG